MAVAWGIYRQRTQEDDDVKETILSRSTGQALGRRWKQTVTKDTVHIYIYIVFFSGLF